MLLTGTRSSPPAANVMPVSGSGVQVIDSPLLTQQIEAQRLCIKHLKNDNNRMKVFTPSSDVDVERHMTPFSLHLGFFVSSCRLRRCALSSPLFLLFT